MSAFDADVIDRLARQLNEPAWLTDLRRQALTRHAELPWPHPSDDVWRRTDVSLLDPVKGFSPAEHALLHSIRLSEPQWERLIRPLDGEQRFVWANGSRVTEDSPRGLTCGELSQAARERPDSLRRIIEADGLTEAEQKLTTLNGAFHDDDLFVQIPEHVSTAEPFHLVRLFSVSDGQAIFPMTVITVGSGSSVTLIDEYISVPATGAAAAGTGLHLINGRIELVLEPGASVRYIRLQRWAPTAREFLFQRATLSQDTSLTMANINLGASLSKAHVVTKLTGERASARLYGFVFGHHGQHVDQHTFQDHQAPRTSSDLQFRAALQDESRMIYTGLIRIAKSAQQTDAFQANHNLLLSPTAKAETIPMLEILADDVHCKHGASVGPIDEEQVFYLMSRGIPRETAQRLVVMGFIEPIIQEVPFPPLQELLRQDIERGLHDTIG